MTKLAELQRRFWQLISAPVTVERALPELTARDPGIAPLGSWIRAASDEAAVERLNVYANMYFFRLLDVLQGDYPDLAKLVGADDFHNLVTDYLAACPSQNPSIRHVGGRLGDFLATHHLARRFPAAPDLARLEWARGLAFDAADAPGELAPDALAAIPAQDWGGLRLALVPSFRAIALGFPVHALWQALERGEAPPALEPAPSEILIWRRGFQVYHRTAARDEAALLASILAGAPFGAVCEQLAARRAGDDQAAIRAAFAFLTTWIDQGLLSGAAS